MRVRGWFADLGHPIPIKSGCNYSNRLQQYEQFVTWVDSPHPICVASIFEPVMNNMGSLPGTSILHSSEACPMEWEEREDFWDVAGPILTPPLPLPRNTLPPAWKACNASNCYTYCLPACVAFFRWCRADAVAGLALVIRPLLLGLKTLYGTSMTETWVVSLYCPQ